MAKRSQVTELYIRAGKLCGRLGDDKPEDMHSYALGIRDALAWGMDITTVEPVVPEKLPERSREMIRAASHSLGRAWVDDSDPQAALAEMNRGNDESEPPECPICSRTCYSGTCTGCGYTDDAENKPRVQAEPSISDLLASSQAEMVKEREVEIRCEAILGPAGCGKSYEIQQRIKADPNYAILAATTGAAAVNLGDGVTTINSLLKYFDLAALRLAHSRGHIATRLYNLARAGYKNLVIDEVSMLTGGTLDIIYEAAVQAARRILDAHDSGQLMEVEPLGLIVTGDFLQLPPVSRDGMPDFAFTAKCWPKFEANLQLKTTNYRQTGERMQKAMFLARHGRGTECAFVLKELGVRFVPEPLKEFPGVTLFATNPQVDKYNRERLAELTTPEYTYESRRWGKASSDWDQIPDKLTLKIGCKVMILANETSTFSYVNGDTGTVLSSIGDVCITCGLSEENCAMEQLECPDVEEHKYEPDIFKSVYSIGPERLPFHLKRLNGYELKGFLEPIVRQTSQAERPEDAENQWMGGKYDPKKFERDDRAAAQFYAELDRYRDKMWGVPYFDPVKEMWVTGEIEFMPVRLGYSCTIHKAQGLTLDAVQVDARPRMADGFALMYVALSRAKTPEGITIVGDLPTFSRRVKTSPAVRRFI